MVSGEWTTSRSRKKCGVIANRKIVSLPASFVCPAKMSDEVPLHCLWDFVKKFPRTSFSKNELAGCDLGVISKKERAQSRFLENS